MRVTGNDTGRGHRWPGTLLALPALCHAGRVRERTVSTAPPATRAVLASRAEAACRGAVCDPSHYRPRPRCCPPTKSVAPFLALHCLGRERARPFNARRQRLGQLCSVDSLAVRSKDVRLPRHTLRVTSLCVGCLALPAAMAPYRVRRLLLWPCRQPSGEDVPLVPLFRSGDVARVLTPQTSQAMTSPISVVPLAAEAITFNSSWP